MNNTKVKVKHLPAKYRLPYYPENLKEVSRMVEERLGIFNWTVMAALASLMPEVMEKDTNLNMADLCSMRRLQRAIRAEAQNLERDFFEGRI